MIQEKKSIAIEILLVIMEGLSIDQILNCIKAYFFVYTNGTLCVREFSLKEHMMR